MTEGALGARPIAVSLLTGFLGSGKTTLLNHLLGDPGMDRTAVLINEFGAVGLDHLLVRQLDSDVVLLKSGCICCTVQGELVDGLRDLHYRRMSGELPPFDRIVIETTGLADPLPILSCLMRDPLFRHALRIDSLITTVDALHGEGQLAKHVEARHQAAVADSLLLTKTDLTSGEVAEALGRRLRQINPRARMFPVRFGQASPRDVFGGLDPGAMTRDLRRWLGAAQLAPIVPRLHGGQDSHGHAHHEHPGGGVDVNRHDERIRSFCLILDGPIDRRAFEAWYEELAEKRGDSILRVKGIVGFADDDLPYAIHCVQSTWHEPTRLPAWPDEDRHSRIVFILRDLDQATVENGLRAALDASSNRPPVPHAPSGDARGRRWLNDAEASRVLAGLSKAGDRSAADAVRLMLLAGLDAAEVIGTRWEDIDPRRGAWAVRPAVSARAGRPRSVPLGEPIVLLLDSLRPVTEARGPVFPDLQHEKARDRLDAALQTAARAGEVEGLELATLQPARASDTLRGLDRGVVSALLGIPHRPA